MTTITKTLPRIPRPIDVAAVTNRNQKALAEVQAAVPPLQSSVTSLQSSVGTRTSGVSNIADGGTIAHGLGSSPTWVSVTGSVAAQILTVTAKNSTNFTVAIKTTAGAAGSVQDVYWEAKA